MSGRVCYRCGKGSLKGNWVSHANNKNTRRTYANLRLFRMLVEGVGKRVKLCTKCLRLEKEKAKKLKLSQKTEQILAAAATRRAAQSQPSFI